jgi:hypothetical protein
VRAEEVVLAPGAPTRYVVKQGDTLWGISGKFLKDPWRWPELWRMNRTEIKNPHWIYPGDVVVLDMVDGKPRLSLERDGKPASAAVPASASASVSVIAAAPVPVPVPAPAPAARETTVRLSPRIRSTPVDADAIPSIPAGDLQPFLSRPLITGPEGLVNSAEVVAGRDQRVVRGEGDVIYVSGIDRSGGDVWYIYRPGRTFASYDNPGDIVGYEQRFLGSAKVESYGPISTVRITNAREEILVGDQLVPQPRGQLINYAPHSPPGEIGGHIIALEREASEAGVGWIVTIDKGAQDGLDIGTVLAAYKLFAPAPDPRPQKAQDRGLPVSDRTSIFQRDQMLDLPEERTGLVFVYRVFDRVSYALLMRTVDPIEVGNYVRKP